MARLNKFLSASGQERRLFVFSVIVMTAVRVALFCFPLQRVLNMLNTIQRLWPRKASGSTGVRRAVLRINQGAAYCPLTTTCLSRTIAAHYILSWYGFASIPKIGVTKAGGTFAAHAWLECEEGLVIGNRTPEGVTYTPVPSLERFFA